VPRGTLDDDWLPVIGRRRLVVITRDQRIRYRSAEKRAWVDHSVRGFVLTGRRSQTTADSNAILMLHWTKIEALVSAEPYGPWMRAVTSSGLRLIQLV
jgi:isopentenyldiphosphate isomerase